MTLRLSVAAVLAATVLALAGCGSSSKSSGSASSGGGSSAPSGSTIKVGIVAPEGTVAFNDNFEVAALSAAVRGFNARGGIGGHKLQMVYCNDEGDPNTTAKCGRQMISDHVVGVFGGSLLNGGTVLTPILRSAGIPQIGLTAISQQEYTSSNVYLFGTGANNAYSVLAAYAAKHRIPTSLLVTDDTTAKPLVGVLNSVMKSGGSSFTAEGLVESDQADYAPLVQKTTSNSKAVLLFTGPQQGEAYIQTAQTSGAKPLILTAYLWAKSDISKLGGGDVLSRMLTAQQFLPLTANNPVINEFKNDMAAEVKAGDSSAQLGVPGGESSGISGAWLGIWALNQIVKQQHLTDITASTVTKALDATKNLNMEGVMPPWTPNAQGPPGLTRAANNDYYLIAWHNNVPVNLTPKPVNINEILAGKVTVPFGS